MIGIGNLKHSISKFFELLKPKYKSSRNFISPIVHDDPLYCQDYVKVPSPQYEAEEIQITQRLIKDYKDYIEDSLRKPIPLLARIFQLGNNFLKNFNRPKLNTIILDEELIKEYEEHKANKAAQDAENDAYDQDLDQYNAQEESKIVPDVDDYVFVDKEETSYLDRVLTNRARLASQSAIIR